MTATLDTWVPTDRPRCADEPEAWFDPNVTGTKGGRPSSQAAADLCAGCPFIHPCLEAALNYERSAPLSMRFGVWGGTLPWERAAIEKMRNAA